MGRRIGIFGGTFDPPHVAHLVAAIEVRWALGLDEVLLVVANDPWQKSADARVTPAAERLAMVRAAVDGVAGVVASDIEIARGGPSYSADTVAELRARHPDAELVLILGRDAAAGLETWERMEELRGRVTIVVVSRPSQDPVELPEGWDLEDVAIPQLDLSSTEIRRRIAEGRSVQFLVPPGVEHYLARTGLYRGALA